MGYGKRDSKSRKDTRPAVIVRVRKFLSSGITSFSIRRKDSQGCTADVKDTPPSPKENMAKGSMESIDSGVSLKSDQSKDRPINFKDRVSPSGREMNQEVGWKHLEAPVSSCS
ncbi:hypothetical protein ABVT39_015929 [Epinephelus coioides]